MTQALSPNAQAILLLTAPLIAGRSRAAPELLSAGEYKRLARHLWEMKRQPADLLSLDAADLIGACQPVIDPARLQDLLARGFLLSQVFERWQTRAIWVASRADAHYPRRLKTRLREDAPAVLYGCGDISLLDTGGLAVVGSRNVNDELIGYTASVGRLVADADATLVSGGARGVDQAAMLGALNQGGRAIGVLADSLEKAAMNRENRNRLINGQLVLISPYDPSAGFNVGNAMQRNKYIYALADAALVINSDVNKGGTWAGATEQLDKLRMVPVYVRSAGENSTGIDALRKMGAIAWPNPQDVSALKAILEETMPNALGGAQSALSLFPKDSTTALAPETPQAVALDPRSVPEATEHPPSVGVFREDPPADEPPVQTPETRAESDSSKALASKEIRPADALFAVAREVLRDLLVVPMSDMEVAEALEVSVRQAKTWLNRLVDEGSIEKQKPNIYVAKQSRLFG
ncbi:DNA-processing protein DprA [Phreatobacter stygius]|uniref:DNA-processing protein DprA n=1 Tax=Phreatobacter stygius TaxID=1940610 RepID=A0A4D7ATP5_9HYPH|nr:DNA-processing protein DprA [Phreatobacter stygius]QCI62965.1 DNA-processing protein DprA [Phreatobacter stygius]